jgi:dolichol-phosphate mannosyltransferase
MKSHKRGRVSPEISVILPTYNERENIIRLIDGLETVLKPWSLQIVVVDDDSPDGTSRVVSERAEKDGCILLLTRKDKRGLASALADGVTISSGEMIIFMDSDMQMEPGILPGLIKILENGYDVAVGSRWMAGGADLRCESEQGSSLLSRTNRHLSRYLSKIASFAFQVNHSDFTGGLIAMRKSVLDGYRIRGDHGDYLLYLLHYILTNNFRVKEIPYVLLPRREGMSKTADNYLDFFIKGCRYLNAIIKLAFFRNHKQ